MQANMEFEVYCPWDGDVLVITDGITAPGWFVVVHEHPNDGELHTFGVFVSCEVTI